MNAIKRDIADAHHLLTHLGNVKALRRNALTAGMFIIKSSSGDVDDISVARRIRTMVMGIVESLRRDRFRTAESLHARRQYEIVMRYEIRRESRHEVATHLGISQSKFYYERRAALSRVAAEVKTYTQSVAVYYEVAPDNFELEEHYAFTLKELGEFELSAKALGRLTSNATTDSRRIIALCRLVEVLCEAGRVAEAIKTLAQARFYEHALCCTGFEKTLVTAELCLAESRLAWYQGELSTALQTVQRAEHALATFQGDNIHKEKGPRVLRISTLHLLGTVNSELGKYDAGTETLLRAANELRLWPAAPVPTRAKVLARLAYALATSPTVDAFQIQRALELNREALGDAAKSGSARAAVHAHINEGIFRYWCGDPASAILYVRAAQAIADLTFGSIDRRLVSIIHAEIEAAWGNSRSALARIVSANSSLPEDCWFYLISRIIESRIRTNLGTFQSAAAIATLACTKAATTNSSRDYGLAAVSLGQAQEHLGDRKSAAEATATAIEMLEKGGPPLALAEAFACSSRVTGNKQHRANAADLFAILHQSVPNALPSGVKTV